MCYAHVEKKNMDSSSYSNKHCLILHGLWLIFWKAEQEQRLFLRNYPAKLAEAAASNSRLSISSRWRGRNMASTVSGGIGWYCSGSPRLERIFRRLISGIGLTHTALSTLLDNFY